MGYGSTETNVLSLLFALEEGFLKQSYKLERGAGSRRPLFVRTGARLTSRGGVTERSHSGI